MAKCEIFRCKEETSFNYEWEQGGIKKELWLCKYCEAQLSGEMQKQICIERMLMDR